MARSYQSALPTWSTYTPHVSPLGIQAPINQEVIWRNRARQFTPAGIHGELNRQYMGIEGMVRGTGAGAAAVAATQHRPIMNALQSAATQRRSSRQWAEQVQEAMQRQTPEDITAPGEEHPQSEMQVRAARTAAPTVNPVDLQTQDAARQASEMLTAKTVASKNAGTTTIPGTSIPVRDRRATKGK